MKSKLLSTAAPAPSMETAPAPDETYLPSRKVAQRYSCCVRTLDRWLSRRRDDGDGEGSGDDGNDGDPPADGFPAPMVWNGRRYWRLADLVSWERRRALASLRQPAEAAR